MAPEVSALDYTNEVVIAGYALPALSTRRAETEVELKDGQSFGISGILDHRTTDSLSKMPGIADIPVLGQLFRSKNLNRSTMELVVIVTPKIIDTAERNRICRRRRRRPWLCRSCSRRRSIKICPRTEQRYLLRKTRLGVRREDRAN